MVMEKNGKESGMECDAKKCEKRMGNFLSKKKSGGRNKRVNLLRKKKSVHPKIGTKSKCVLIG